MIIERVEIEIKAGHEDDFQRAMEEGKKLLTSAPGCKSAVVGRGVEAPSKAIMLIEWDAVSSHTAFLEAPEYGQLGALIGGYFAGAPAMEHFVIT